MKSWAAMFCLSCEVPAVRIEGCGGGEKVHFIVIEAGTGRFVRGEAIEVYPGKVLYWPLAGLKEGEYVASLKVPGMIESESCRFRVSR